ncbi:MAG: ATP-binding cassette domain-containing protein, partial [Candidatus Thermoplasmatota archaeon]
MHAIVVENLTKRFGDILAVNNISFKVNKGEIFSFLGPNGAGKTTTIHILVTILKPTSGNAFVARYNVLKEAREVRKRIGIVFQEPSLDTNLTAYENLCIHGGIYGYSRSDLKNKIDELLKFVELENFKNKVVKTFSGGMARRLEVAKALIHEPEILFLDEPTIGLDPQTRSRIWEYIEKLRDEKDITIFLTTHYMDEAEQLSDRIAIIDNGKIVAYDNPENLKSM